jgi:hypothetical protein
MNQSLIATLRRILAAAALVCLCVQAAAAQTKPWTERPYNPQIGSRWLIDTDSQSEENRAAGERRTQKVGTVSELTIDEKLADGFRVTYVLRDMQFSGNAPGTEIAGTAFSGMKGIVIRARTDASGKPVAIENIDEVKAAMRTVVARLVDNFSAKPQVAALIKQLMDGFLIVDGAAAATTYMEDVPVLAAGQNTGLTPGAVKRDTEQVANPMGGPPIKSVLISRLESWDNATGRARIVRRREMDQEALRQATLSIVRQLATAASDKVTPEMLKLLDQVKFSVETSTAIDVQDGMARMIEDRSTTTASVMGHTFIKVEKKIVKVTEMK